MVVTISFSVFIFIVVLLETHPFPVATWNAIASIFLDNQETQAVVITTQLRKLEQGALSMHDYFARLKDLAN